MCKCSIVPGPGLTQPQADFMGCLITAALAAAPVFFKALMDCLGAGGQPGGDDQFEPGDRVRCQ